MITEQEQYLDKLAEATTELLISTGEKLYAALAEQNYELAAKLRDTNQQIVSEAAKAFHQQIPYSIEFYTNHFNNQVEFIFDSMIKTYGEII
jgi:excinuclease UvrABC nuclease subunit